MYHWSPSYVFLEHQYPIPYWWQLHSICIPSPSLPDPTPISTTKSLILLSLVYTYAVFPLIPTISTAASAGFKLEEGYGKWWGNYCIDKSNWWRIGKTRSVSPLTPVRPITLLPLLILTIYLCFITLSSLYSNIGHPSLYIRPKRTDWSLTFYLLVCSVGGMSYLIVEQVIGWRWNWWPRIFECRSSPTILPRESWKLTISAFTSTRRHTVSFQPTRMASIRLLDQIEEASERYRNQ